MKLWITILSLVFSQFTFANVPTITDSFLASDVLKYSLNAVEQEHQVRCDQGRATTLIPKVIKKVKYVTNCGNIKIKITAKFKNASNPDFKLNRVKVWARNNNLLQESETFTLTSDPFLKAYKKSQTVRDVRHFVESTYEVVCREGTVRKGLIGGKAHYFYFAKCTSDNQVVKLKLKSKVKIINDHFKFELMKYKLTMK